MVLGVTALVVLQVLIVVWRNSQHGPIAHVRLGACVRRWAKVMLLSESGVLAPQMRTVAVWWSVRCPEWA